jgi:hypothetical protein
MRTLLLAFASVALASCWYGNTLYTPSDARPAITPGVYRLTAGDEPAKVYRVSMLPNGMTQLDGGETKQPYGFAPLDSTGGTYVVWIPIRDEDSATDRGEFQIYLLMMRLQSGKHRIYAPNCKDAEAEIAAKNGAVIEAGTPPACRFASRAALEKAMRLLPRDESSAATLIRMP